MSLRTKSYDVTIQMKPLCLYLHMVLFVFSKFHKMKFGNLLLAKFSSQRVKRDLRMVSKTQNLVPRGRDPFVQRLITNVRWRKVTEALGTPRMAVTYCLASAWRDVVMGYRENETCTVYFWSIWGWKWWGATVRYLHNWTCPFFFSKNVFQETFGVLNTR